MSYDTPEEQKIPNGRSPSLRVRILATSDLHMQVLDYDYVRDQPSEDGSLAKLAVLIEKARKDADICLLLDNGDTLQGTPMANYIARAPSETAHPMVAAMNALQYDAVGLGNHDFDFGLSLLGSALAQYASPIVCSNLESPLLPQVQRHVLLERRAAPEMEPVRIGLVGAIPQMTSSWNRYHLQGQIQISPALEAVAQHAHALREAGADIVIALAHMGITLGDEGDAPQNQVVDIAGLDDIDVVIGGHTHLRFPGPDHEGTALVDCARGLVHGKPVVQPGPCGADLGQIDLELERQDTHWRIVANRVALRASLPNAPEDEKTKCLLAAPHAATRAYLEENVAHIDVPIHSFFALATPSPVPALMARAKSFAVQAALAQSPLSDLPLLAAASAPATGGFDGPQNFVSLQAGNLRRRHIAGLNRYANQVWAVRTTGARLKDWLERAALIFETLTPDQPNQVLINSKVPGFRFDAIYGLEYCIDPTRPPAFDLAGRRIPEAEGRVSDLRWNGAPLDPEQLFVVATTDHRVGGGGAHLPFLDDEVILRGSAPIEDALLGYLGAPLPKPLVDDTPWRFPEALGTTALLNTSPAALDHLDDIAFYKPEVCGTTDEGFLQIRLHL